MEREREGWFLICSWFQVTYQRRFFHYSCSLHIHFDQSLSYSYSPDGIQEFKIRTEVRTEVPEIRQESWLFYRQIFQDFAAIATKFLRFLPLNS